MKLVELLARELKEWPKNAEVATQDQNRNDGRNNTCFSRGPLPVFEAYHSGEWSFQASGSVDCGHRECLPQAGDYTTAIVTREMWYEERAKALVKTDNPLQWRDRVHAIDAEIHALDTAHTAVVEAREEERIALVQRLELEGLRLSTVTAKPTEDPSDWSTWKAGDIVECLEDEYTEFTAGRLYVFTGEDEHRHCGVERDDEGDPNGMSFKYFKLHTRAAK